MSTVVMYPHLHLSRGGDTQNQVQPNVGKDAPGCRDKKYSKVFDFARLSIGNHVHTHSNDDEHVEGSAAHDSTGTQRASLETVTTNLYVG